MLCIHRLLYGFVRLISVGIGAVPHRRGHSPPCRQEQGEQKHAMWLKRLCRKRIFPNLPLHRQRGMAQFLPQAPLGLLAEVSLDAAVHIEDLTIDKIRGLRA